MSKAGAKHQAGRARRVLDDGFQKPSAVKDKAIFVLDGLRGFGSGRMLPARIERIRGARFRITVSPSMDFTWTGDRGADVLAAMTKVNALLEQ